MSAFVLVHGFACDHSDWDAQARHLASRGHVIHTPDLRGHGGAPGTPAECTIESYGADIAKLLETLDAPAVLAGHSMGCRVVLEAYARAPGRVAALALVDGSRMGAGDAVQAAQAMRAAIDFAGYAAFADALFSQMFLRPSADSRRIVARAKRLPAAIGASLFPDIVRWDAARMDEALAAVRVPLQVIQSTTAGSDRKRVPLKAGETSPWLELVRARVPGARIEVIPGAGHFPQIETPARVNALLEMLP
jgi:pimeloyl-ACP methyl ester carboxylesterase